MFALGVDPGLSRCGYGLVQRAEGGALRAAAAGVIETAPEDALAARLLELHCELGALLAELRPDVVVVERVFFQVNARTAMSVGQASGLALLAAASAGADVAQYTANEVKLALVGYGAATKQQVQHRWWPGCSAWTRSVGRRTSPTRWGSPCATSPRPACAGPSTRHEGEGTMIGLLRGRAVSRARGRRGDPRRGRGRLPGGGHACDRRRADRRRHGGGGDALRAHPRTRGRHRPLRLRARRRTTVLRGAPRLARGGPGTGARHHGFALAGHPVDGGARRRPRDVVHGARRRSQDRGATVDRAEESPRSAGSLDASGRRRRGTARGPRRARRAPKRGRHSASWGTRPTRSGPRSTACATMSAWRRCCDWPCESWPRGESEGPPGGAGGRGRRAPGRRPGQGRRRRGARGSRAPAALPGRVRRSGRTGRASRHRDPGGTPARPAGRPPPLRRTARAGQDVAGRHRGRRDASRSAHHGRPRADARR